MDLIENLRIDNTIYVSLIFFLIVIPIATSMGAEYAVVKHVSLKVTLIVTSVSMLLIVLSVYQLKSTYIDLSDETLSLNSLMYKSDLDLDTVDNIEYFKDGLPYEYLLLKRTNGIGLKNYYIGNFQVHGNKNAFVLATYPPFLVVTTKDKNLYIFSASENLHKSFVESIHQASSER